MTMTDTTGVSLFRVSLLRHGTSFFVLAPAPDDVLAARIVLPDGSFDEWPPDAVVTEEDLGLRRVRSEESIATVTRVNAQVVTGSRMPPPRTPPMVAQLTVGTDGACSGNPGPAGWAWVDEHGKWRSGGLARSTNQVGEASDS